MAVAVLDARAHHGQRGPHRTHERRGARRARAVVGHLEHVARELAVARNHEPRLTRLLDVARKQEAARAVIDAQHERIVVHVERVVHGGTGAEHRQREPPEACGAIAQRARVSDACAAPAQPGDEGLRRFAVCPRFEHGAGVPKLVRRHRREHRGQPAEVVRVRVAEHHEVELRDASGSQRRHDHARSRVDAPLAPARVDEDRVAGAELDQRRIALAHVEEGHAQRVGGEPRAQPELASRHERGRHHEQPEPALLPRQHRRPTGHTKAQRAERGESRERQAGIERGTRSADAHECARRPLEQNGGARHAGKAHEPRAKHQHRERYEQRPDRKQDHVGDGGDE
jgi:hypothetical protein